MEQKIANLIKKYYKTAKVYSVTMEDSLEFGEDCAVVIECVAGRNYPYIALRILNAFPSVKYVEFTGGWIQAIYTRGTLKLAGYKVKEFKTK